MLISEKTTVTWNSRNKKHYVDCGYKFTKMKDIFYVDVKDLTCGSQAIVEVRCDYCNRVFTAYWYEYAARKRKEVVHKDCCGGCCEFKALDAVVKNYGGYSGLYRETNKKRAETNIKNYGSENVFGSDVIKKKIAETNLAKYGVIHNQQNSDIRDKVHQTCIKKYGVENYIELFRGRFIGENSPCWKGGVEYHRVERSNYEYISWRTSVFSRDQYTCQKCHLKNGNNISVILNAHHIQNWRDNVDLRYSIDNGITLCDTCHKSFHSIYGKRNNTVLQIKEFLDDYSDKKIC